MVETIRYFFTEYKKESNDLLDFNCFAAAARRLAVGIVDEYASEQLLSPEIELDLKNAIDTWLNDTTHGIRHSHEVFLKARELREKAGSQFAQVSDSELAFMAIVHDAHEFLPVLATKKLATKKQGNGHEVIDQTEQKGSRRAKEHDVMMSALLRRLALSTSDAETTQLLLQAAQAVRHHDVFWSRPSEQRIGELGQQLSPAGQLLADADRLAANPEQILKAQIRAALERNRNGSLGKWYLCRKDLTIAERFAWEMRTKGKFDGLCAVLCEFCSPSYLFYTEAARKEYEKRKQLFVEVLVEYYGELYQQTKAQFGTWKKEDIFYGIRGVDAQAKKPLGDMDIAQLLAMPVKIAKEQGGRKEYGYSLVTTVNGQEQWLDPSLLQFESEAQFEHWLRELVNEYQAEGLKW